MLKLMSQSKHFDKEIAARASVLDPQFVVELLWTMRASSDQPSLYTSLRLSSESGLATGGRTQGGGGPTPSSSFAVISKEKAEMTHCLVMPLMDRNMFVAIKQERFAGINMDEVRFIFKQLVNCVAHLHSKGLIHGDIKPLNLVRQGSTWKLIDLDASSRIGSSQISSKSSTAYAPPEALAYFEGLLLGDLSTLDLSLSLPLPMPLPSSPSPSSPSPSFLISHPSFDVWSLACVLYNLTSVDARPLFQSDQNDNLSRDPCDEDNVSSLLNWTDAMKIKKLSKVSCPLAKNLLSRMLLKDAARRPSLDCILCHPFISGRSVTRLLGQPPLYDIFLSYRVASDLHHAELLFNLLSKQGLKVFWDKVSLEPGVSWKSGFCSALVNSRIFVCIISNDSINHETKPSQNFAALALDSKVDNVLLEYRFALELRDLGLIEKIFPIMIGAPLYDAVDNSNERRSIHVDASASHYSNFFASGGMPLFKSDIYVALVEEDLVRYMEDEVGRYLG